MGVEFNLYWNSMGMLGKFDRNSSVMLGKFDRNSSRLFGNFIWL